MTFDEIYKTYWQKVFRLCMGYLNDHAGAKDMAQETFIKVWQHLPKFRNESALGTWIFRIAVNNCLRQIEKNKKQPMVNLSFDIKADYQPKIEDKVDFLYKCIAALPEIDRIIISLSLEEVKQTEIANIIGVSEGNVRVKIHRIKEKLAKKFKKYVR